MKPLKVLVYKTLVSAAKAQGEEVKVKPGVLVTTDLTEYDNGSWFESGLVIFEDGTLTYEPLDRIEVLPNQFDTETVISIDVPGAINIAMDN